jgi:hypothetical protein
MWRISRIAATNDVAILNVIYELGNHHWLRRYEVGDYGIKEQRKEVDWLVGLCSNTRTFNRRQRARNIGKENA